MFVSRELPMPSIDFSLETKLAGRREGDFLRKFREIARPMIPDWVAWLLENPPRNQQSAERWSDIFDDLRATNDDLRDLLNSSNPLVKLAARSARGEP